jgi:hypothetical protein
MFKITKRDVAVFSLGAVAYHVVRAAAVYGVKTYAKVAYKQCLEDVEVEVARAHRAETEEVYKQYQAAQLIHPTKLENLRAEWEAAYQAINDKYFGRTPGVMSDYAKEALAESLKRSGLSFEEEVAPPAQEQEKAEQAPEPARAEPKLDPLVSAHVDEEVLKLQERLKAAGIDIKSVDLSSFGVSGPMQAAMMDALKKNEDRQ